ncbi:MAG: glycosyltransferase [Bryobacteraceae bacterium]
MIPVAGRGSRAFPKISGLPKVLLEVGGKTLLERNIELLRDQLNIREIYLIVGHLQAQIRARCGDGSGQGVVLHYTECADPDVGLARGLALLRSQMNGPFVTILGDELYVGSNHGNLPLSDHDTVCGVMRGAEADQIRCNYSVEVDNGRIVALEEKPVEPRNDLLGCGTFVFTLEIFDAIDATPPSSRAGRVELIDAIARLAVAGRVVPFFLEGAYCNVNTPEDHRRARAIWRSCAVGPRRVSVVIPARNEEVPIREVVRDFREQGYELLVIDNGSTDGTAARAAAAGAVVETVHLKGYGDTIRHGLDAASGEILAVVEADYSFRARDLRRLLDTLPGADMAVGTRTHREWIQPGANMTGLLRWGNVFAGRLLGWLWPGRGARFSDVGCTYRVLWRDSYRTMRPLLRANGPDLSPEMMVVALRTGQTVIEIPVEYHPRAGGESKHSASYPRIARTALRMLRTVLSHRLGWR